MWVHAILIKWFPLKSRQFQKHCIHKRHHEPYHLSASDERSVDLKKKKIATISVRNQA